jgi:hypothetical protein
VATKKQRRRREKLQRHEYEYVVEDEEGEEIVVESPRTAAPASQKTATGPPKVVDRRGRVIQPPSWSRVLKRGAIFGPLLAILIWVTGGSLSTSAKLFNIVLLLVIFLPFSYLVDAMIYRAVQRRQRKDAGG